MIVACSADIAVSAPFAKWTKIELVLNNVIVQLIIKLPAKEGQFLNTFYKPLIGIFQYFNEGNMQDAFVLVNNMDWVAGIVIGTKHRLWMKVIKEEYLKLE